MIRQDFATNRTRVPTDTRQGVVTRVGILIFCVVHLGMGLPVLAPIDKIFLLK
jgi:hypothetical protein